MARLYYNYERETIEGVTTDWILYSNQPFYSITTGQLSNEWPTGLTDPNDSPSIGRKPMFVKEHMYDWLSDGEYITLPADASYVFAYTTGDWTQQAWRQQNLDFSLVENATGMFYGSGIKSFGSVSIKGLENIHVYKAMFKDCTSLNYVRFNSDAMVWAEDMSQMCMNCTSLQRVLFEGEYSSSTRLNAVDYMFYNCNSLWEFSADLGITNVTSVEHMLDGCNALQSFATTSEPKNITNFECAFRNCKTLTRLDLSKWSFDKSRNLIDMFRGCDNLVRIDLPGTISDYTENCSGCFRDCPNLQYIYAPYRTDWNISITLVNNDMFTNSTKLPDFDPNEVDIMSANNIKNDYWPSYFMYHTNSSVINYKEFGKWLEAVIFEKNADNWVEVKAYVKDGTWKKTGTNA